MKEAENGRSLTSPGCLADGVVPGGTSGAFKDAGRGDRPWKIEFEPGDLWSV